MLRSGLVLVPVWSKNLNRERHESGMATNVNVDSQATSFVSYTISVGHLREPDIAQSYKALRPSGLIIG